MGHPTRTALGLASGYLLGRYHKAGWLVMAAVAMAASKRLGESLAGSSSPELKKLVDQSRETATALMGNQVQGLTSRLQATTESLRQPVQEKGNGDSEQQQGEQQAGGEQEQGDQQQEEQQQAGGEQEQQAGGEQEQQQGNEQQGNKQQGSQQQAEGEEQASGEQNIDRGQGGEPKERSQGTSRDRRSQVSGRPATSAAARRRR